PAEEAAAPAEEAAAPAEEAPKEEAGKEADKK
ncbi:MAG: cytochrome c family protein, partial [Nitrosomonadales bacterium]|nr:cytochrome c family protein [Nitrosomonadales bacterium]